MITDVSMIPFLEEIAANTWPAHVQESLGTWRLRATFGITKRANSVFAVGPFPESVDWLTCVEDFCKRHAIPACYYVGEASPKELDGILESLGYAKIDECSTMIRLADQLMEQLVADERFTAHLSTSASEEWIRDFIRLEGFQSERFPAYVHIFSAMGPQKVFLRLCENGETVGLGTVVAERGWAGLCNIVVDPNHRRKGVAGQVIRALVDWAIKQHIRQVYLQVVNANTAAVSLYRKLGFETLSQYHYRLQPPPLARSFPD